MKVVRLQAENIKRLIAVDITPDGAVVQITGKNGAGKSSVLDSIWYALGGERNIPGEPVRKGEKSAKVTLNLGDLIVERKWTEKGTYLAVTTNDGLKYPNPQKILDALCGTLTFDPLEFARLKADEQAKTLAKLVGLDLSEIEAERAKIYDERREVNRDVKRLEVECSNLPTEQPESLDVATAEAAVREAREAERRATSHEQALSTARTAVERAKAEHQKAAEAITAARRRAALAEAEVSNLEASLNELIEQEPPAPTIDLDAAIQAVRRANESQQALAHFMAAEARREQLHQAEARSRQLTAELAALDIARDGAVGACTFPLPALEIVNGIVRYGGVPFDQCSSAEQLRVSMAIAMKMNPQLRILRISDGSLLDADNLQMITDLATAEDYQVWLETVDSDDASAVLIADGRLARPEEVAA